MNAGMRWGTLCGVAAGAVGLVFVVPLLLPDYPRRCWRLAATWHSA
jgi:hypothetical protein